MTDLTAMPENYDNIRTEIVELLKTARSTAARNVNSIMTATYWEIGRRIVKLEQGGERRAGYGEQLIEQLATDLTRQFGRGFGQTNLKQMRTFYQAWPEPQIRQTLSDESAIIYEDQYVTEHGYRPIGTGEPFRLALVCLRPDALC